MAVRWQITFKTIKDRTGLVKIYDSDYSGDPIELTPAVNPFSTTISRSDMMEPVASDSGYLRVISTGAAAEYIEDIHPMGGMDRPVEFYLDGELQWRGFISPEAYSLDWESAPTEVSFSLVGVLQALEGVNMTDTGVGRQTIAAFLKEILTATGFTWSKIIFPPQLLYLNITDYPFSPTTFGEARLALSRYNYIHANQNDERDDPTWTEMVGDSYMTCLSDICRYFGWVAYQYGDALVLDSPRRDLTSLDVITLAQLDLIIADPTASVTVTHSSRGAIQVTGLDFDGNQHRKSINNGCRKVSVKTTDNVSGDVYPSLDFKGNTIKTWDQDFTPGSDHFYARVCWLNTEREHVKLHAYRFVDGHVTEVPWAPPAQNSELSLPAGSVVKAETWQSFDDKANYNFINYIRISANLGNNVHFDTDVPMIEITSRQIGCFPAGGALCISGNVRNSFFLRGIASEPTIESAGLTQVGSFDNNIRMSLAVGEKWWNGSAWVNQEAIFSVRAEQPGGDYPFNGTFSTGQVKNTKTLSMPYNGAMGYIIPISTMLEGMVKVKIYPWISDVPEYHVWGEDFAALYISDLAFRYYADTDNQNEDGISMSLPAGDKFREEKSVQLNITSSLDNKIGLATLWHGNDPAEKFGYDDIAAAFIRPERKLLRTLKELYSLPATELVLQIDAPSFKPYQTLQYDSKNYMVMGQVTDYADEHTKLTIMSYE